MRSNSLLGTGTLNRTVLCAYRRGCAGVDASTTCCPQSTSKTRLTVDSRSCRCTPVPPSPLSDFLCVMHSRGRRAARCMRTRTTHRRGRSSHDVTGRCPRAPVSAVFEAHRGGHIGRMSDRFLRATGRSHSEGTIAHAFSRVPCRRGSARLYRGTPLCISCIEVFASPPL